MKEMGTIEFHGITELFDSETELTSWLADHLDELVKQVGLDIEKISVEEPVGSFRCDIYGWERKTNRKVVIENQLYRSDHSHLGQLLTYASGLDAGIVMWMTPELSDEHRGALDWLNEHASEDLWFFGVRVRAARIADSPLAPLFEVVARPNVQFKEAQIAGQASERKHFYREFFSTLLEKLRKAALTSSRQTVGFENWLYVGAVRGASFVLSFAQGSRFRIELYTETGSPEKNREMFEHLSEQREQIENELGAELSWEPMEERKACRIALYHPCIDYRADAPQLAEWTMHWFPRFKAAFERRLQSFRSTAP